MNPLSQDQLAAFVAVAKTRSFTRAAAELHLSQPALSRRVAGLEEALGTSLLVRGPAVTITEAGRRLLAFAQAQRSLEDELLADLRPETAGLTGVVRIAGLSSIVPALVLPPLAPLLREHPAIQLEIYNFEVGALSTALLQGATDFAFTDRAPDRAGITSIACGHEEFVVVEADAPEGRRDVFLDSRQTDRTTDWFFAAQPRRLRPRAWRRSFMHDEDGILAGVELGLGRAIKPRHAIPSTSPARIDPTFVPVRKPVYLQYRTQRYQGRLHERVAALLDAAVRAALAGTRAPAPRRRR